MISFTKTNIYLILCVTIMYFTDVLLNFFTFKYENVEIGKKYSSDKLYLFQKIFISDYIYHNDRLRKLINEHDIKNDLEYIRNKDKYD